MESLWIWIDHSVKKPDDAYVNVLDHGFLYGDSVYETIRTHHGSLFAVEPHLDRLERSAAAIGLRLPESRAAIRSALEQTAAAGPENSDVGLRLMVTRGVGPLGLDTEQCHDPKLIIFGWPISAGRHPRFKDGFHAIVAKVRRNPVDALDPGIKSGNFLNNILAFREAKQRGVDEAILLTLEGDVAEGTTSNVFWVTDGRVFTPQASGILPGVTRAHLLEVMAASGIDCEPGVFPESALRNAQEIFITSTLKGVLAITELDGTVVGTGAPGPLTKRIADLYDASLPRTSDPPKA